MAPCLIIMGDGREGGSAAICCTEEGRKMDAESPLSVTTKRTLSIFSPRPARTAAAAGTSGTAPPPKSLSVLLIAQILQKRFHRQILRFQIDVKRHIPLIRSLLICHSPTDQYRHHRIGRHCLSYSQCNICSFGYWCDNGLGTSGQGT